VSDFLRVSINIVLGWFFKNTLLGGVSNVYAANQVVDTTKSPTTFIDTTANGVDLINIANPNSVGVSVMLLKLLGMLNCLL
jgi:hypothetical protein